MRASIAFGLHVLAPAVGALLSIPMPAQGQVAYDSPKGRVEVLGLKRWTLVMLQDSIRRYAPGQELHDAACMITLRDSLHFVEASVVGYEMGPPGGPARTLLSIKVVEPEQAASVQWDERRRNDFTSLLPDYAPLILPLTDSTGGVWSGRLVNWLQLAEGERRQRALASAPASARQDAERLSAFLDGHARETDRARAMRVLARDGLWVNRMTAVAVLSRFAAHDSTWLALVRALRDPHEGVRQTAEVVIRGLPSRAIDWRPSTDDLRLLVGGTNLSAIETVFTLLARTSVAPELASPLLRDNGQWVLDHLGSEMPMAGDAAHRFLVRLNAGHDLGRTRAAWAPWVQSQ